MRRFRWMAMLVLPAIVAGCGGPTVVPLGSPYTMIGSFYDYGAGGRDLQLTVIGNPFTTDKALLDRAIEVDAQVPLLRQPTHPTLTPGASAKKGYQVMFVLSPAPTLSGGSAGKGEATAPVAGAPSAGGESVVRILGAFCISGWAATEVQGQTPASGPDDPRVAALVRQLMLELFRPDLPLGMISDFSPG